MAQTTLRPSGPNSPLSRLLSFVLDTRVIGVLLQIAFIIVIGVIAAQITGNFRINVGNLGEAQFICRDGSTSYRCAYDFMSSEAAFDISETIVEYEITDSYWYALYMGFLNTLKVAVLGIILATLLGTFAGIIRLSDNWLLSNIVKWYIELIRNTPLLVQLVFIYFGVVLAFPSITAATRPLGLPIYLTQRGLSIPLIETTSSFSTWMAFLILGIIQFQVLWIFLGRREEKTGRSSNRWMLGILSFLIVAGIGWVVSTATSENQGIMVTTASRIRDLDDVEQLILTRAGINHLDDLNRIPAEQVAAAALQICVLRDSPSEANLTSELRSQGIPYNVNRFDRPGQATNDYVDGGCDLIAGTQAMLASERSTLESPAANLILPVLEKPIVFGIPSREGLNIAGGSKMSPEFTALLAGLVIYTAAFIAEVVRAGIMSVSKGQSEAARALGLSEGQRLQLIVLPQALRVIIPPLTSQYLNLTKNSSLAIAIAFPDLWSISFTTINQSGRAIQVFLIVMLTYLTMSLVTSTILNWYNEKTKLVER